MSSIATADRILAIRLRILGLFRANPDVFDIIFVANATSGIKLIADGFCGSPNGFRYKYLQDAHTSLIGAGQLTRDFECLSEEEVNSWIDENVESGNNLPGLFAYPAQSNFNGRRFPLNWIRRLRENRPGWYSLLDAASYLTTTPLDYSDLPNAPDFTVLSFYKVFGYPDLGAIIVRRDASHILFQRRYFGGGTRAAITPSTFHAPRREIHDALEDGTLPFHAILALDAALDNFTRLYGGLVKVSRHAAQVTRLAYRLLSSLRHSNGLPVCHLYSPPDHGPIIAFNLVSANGTPVGFASFENLCSLRNIALRTGGMCNPGGLQNYLNLQDWEVERNHAKGKVCGDDMDIVDGKYTGAIRISFGACSTIEEVCELAEFIQEFYVEKLSVQSGISDATAPIAIQSISLCNVLCFWLVLI